LTADDLGLLQKHRSEREIFVLNKSDLPDRKPLKDLSASLIPPELIQVSAVTGKGLETLERAIATVGLRTSGAIDENEIVLAIPRHVELLARAEAALRNTLTVLQSEQPLDVAAAELTIAARALGEITGVNATEDLFDTIFSRFCLGK
jgi:tRNA modification GTPase